jgi:hypothetical protein
MRRWATLREGTRAVTPARKNDKVKKNQGRISTQTLGAVRNSPHQMKEAPRKIPPILYMSTTV